MTEAEYPLLLHFPYYLLYSSQVVKQADLVFAQYICSECFSPEQKLRDFDYYEAITVRDSSLSAAIQAIVAAEVGHLDLAYEYLRETAFVDLWDLAGNTDDGVHLAAMAGAALASVAGFGGMRDHGDTLTFAPRLPDPITRMAFGIVYRDRLIRVEFDADETRYELRDGAPIELVHHGERFELDREAPRTFPNPAVPDVAPVSPPPLRDPCRRGVAWEGRESDIVAMATRG